MKLIIPVIFLWLSIVGSYLCFIDILNTPNNTDDFKPEHLWTLASSLLNFSLFIFWLRQLIKEW